MHDPLRRGEEGLGPGEGPEGYGVSVMRAEEDDSSKKPYDHCDEDSATERKADQLLKLFVLDIHA
jgi:hypothetical protein